jgi:hypothetical protein
MSTERQTRANRVNAQHSTGPRTAGGKKRVASNALKHGLTGKQIVLPNENPHEFDKFRCSLWRDLNPQGAMEEVLVEKIIADAWRRRRVPTLEAALHARDRLLDLEREIERLQSADDLDETLQTDETLQEAEAEKEVHEAVLASLKKANIWLDESTLEVVRVFSEWAPQFQNLSRYEEALSRSMQRELHELQRLQAMRAGEQVAAPAVADLNVHVNRGVLVES